MSHTPCLQCLTASSCSYCTVCLQALQKLPNAHFVAATCVQMWLDAMAGPSPTGLQLPDMSFLRSAHQSYWPSSELTKQGEPRKPDAVCMHVLTWLLPLPSFAPRPTAHLVAPPPSPFCHTGLVQARTLLRTSRARKAAQSWMGCMSASCAHAAAPAAPATGGTVTSTWDLQC